VTVPKEKKFKWETTEIFRENENYGGQLHWICYKDVLVLWLQELFRLKRSGWNLLCTNES